MFWQPSRLFCRFAYLRQFGTTRIYNRAHLLSTEELPDRVFPHYESRSSKRKSSVLYSPESNDASLHSLIWDTPPRNIFVVKKPWNSVVRQSMAKFVRQISQKYNGNVNIIVESDVADEIEEQVDCTLYTGSRELLQGKADLLVTLGGDGTILHASSQFASGDVPPVLSFSLGTLGFLLPFDLKDSQAAFDAVYSSRARVLNRVRIECQLSRPNSGKSKIVHAMNDLNIHRGQDPHLTMLDINVDGEFVTRAIADGVIVSTPTGSTAYSLSSGGSIVHPSVPCILITPICPRSLSFRPLIFPSTASISISMSPQSHGRPADISIDGISHGMLNPEDRITVVTETGPNKGIWYVARNESDWVQNLNGLLGFNSPFGIKEA